MSEKNESATSQDEFKRVLDALPKPKGITVEVAPIKKYDIPQELDLSKFPEDERVAVGLYRQSVEDYINQPSIMDNFNSPDQRSNWRNSMYLKVEKEKGEEFADNFKRFLKGKLSTNRINVLTGPISFFHEYLPKDERTDSQAILDYAKNLPERESNGELQKLGSEGREKEVDLLSEQAARVLTRFAK